MGLYEWMTWMWSAHDHTPSTHSTWVTCVCVGRGRIVSLRSHVLFIYYEFATKHRKILSPWIYLFPNFYHDISDPTSPREYQILRRHPIIDMPQEAIVRLRLLVFILFASRTQHIYLRVKMWPHVPTYFWVATIVYPIILKCYSIIRRNTKTAK
jgi:hypothetical protein